MVAGADPLPAFISCPGSYGHRMRILLDHPLTVFFVTVVILWVASRTGALLREIRPGLQLEGSHFNLAVGATLTLLGVIVGFTFSMALSRYDQRKGLEEQEANAIGTEYLRADALSPADAAKVRALLREYLSQRIVYYVSRDPEVLRSAGDRTAGLRSELWASVKGPATAQPTALSALALSGMNDVLNAEGYAEAAWRNNIPSAAWLLLVTIAAFANLLLGYHARRRSVVLLILPIALAISFFFIAEIDSPRSGVLRVHARNLEMLAESLVAR